MVSTSDGAIGRAGSRGTGTQRSPREGMPETAGKQRSAHPVWAREQLFERVRRRSVPSTHGSCLCRPRLAAVQRQPGITEGNGREAAALCTQSLVVAYLMRAVIPHQGAKLPVRSEGVMRTLAESLGLVEAVASSQPPTS